MQEEFLLITQLRETQKAFTLEDTMSVTQPADSGGGNALGQSLQVIDDMSELNPKMCSWAQLMEEEFIQVAADEEGTDEIDGADSSASPERRRKIPDEPPFKAQVTNISSNHNEEELLYYFGGEDMVKDYEFRAARGQAEFEFLTRHGLLSALEKDDKEFQGKKLKVFVIRNPENAGRIQARLASDYKGGSYDSSAPNSGRRNDSFRNRGSHYNSQTSVNSDRNSRYNDSHNQKYQNYGTMPAGGFDRRASYRGHNYNNNRGNNHGFRQPRNPNYDRQNSGPNRFDDYGGGLQRSGSYQHNQHGNFSRYGAPISSRSRTESHSTNFEQYSRTSSRMSIDEHPKPVVRKVSSNPFGDAKPVDTQTRLLEWEEKQSEKERAEREARQAMQESAAEGDNQDEESKQKSNKKGHNYHEKQHHEHAGGDHPEEIPSHQRRGSFEHGAPPGSVIIKKRDQSDADKERDEECSTPPVDPVQYPVNSESDHHAQHQSHHHHHHHQHHHQYEKNYSTLPPHNPNHHKYSKNSTRPSVKPYVPRGGQVLQKSATMGQIEKEATTTIVEGDERSQRRDEKKYPRGGSGAYRGDGHRRSSFSGSDSGRGENKSRGSFKRGGARGGGVTRGSYNSTRGGGTRGAKRGDGEGRKANEEGQQEAAPAVTIEKESSETVQVVEEKKKEPVKVESVESTIVEEKEREESEQTDKSDVPTPSTPKKKSDRKKEKKKEAKTSHLSGNKFAALLQCSQ